jgi:hypothetical protein
MICSIGRLRKEDKRCGSNETGYSGAIMLHWQETAVPTHGGPMAHSTGEFDSPDVDDCYDCRCYKCSGYDLEREAQAQKASESREMAALGHRELEAHKRQKRHESLRASDERREARMERAHRRFVRKNKAST